MEKKNYIFYTVFLAIYAYEFSKTQQLIAAYNQYHTSMQYGGVAVLGLGFWLYYFSRQLLTSVSGRKILLMIFNIVYVTGMLYMLLVPGNSYIILPVYLSLGYIGAAVYYYIAAALGRTEYVGRVAMISHIMAVLLQMLLPKEINDTGIVIVILIAGFVAITYLMLFPPADWMFEEMLPFAKETGVWKGEIKNRLFGLLVIVIFTDIFGCMVEVSWTTAWEDGAVDMYTFPRLFMIAGYFVAGFFADFKKHKYLDTSLLVMLGIGFSGMCVGDHQMARLSVFYIVAGFIILYMNIKFWHLAPYTKAPELWACFGRILFVFEGVVCELFIKLFAGKTFYSSMMLAFFFAVVAYYVIKESAYKTLGEWILFENGMYASDVNVDIKADSDGKNYETFHSDLNHGVDNQYDKLLSYSLKYELTPREKDVMKCLLESDESMKIIADKLEISERMLYRYMKQLYEKTGTENRIGLVKSYYEYNG